MFWTNKLFLNFVRFISYIFAFYHIVYTLFVLWKPFFLQMKKYYHIKIYLVCSRIFNFSYQKCLFRFLDDNNIWLKRSLYRYHLCFVAIHRSNVVSLNVSDNPRVKCMAVSLIHLFLCLVWQTKPKLAWRHNFFDVYYYRETSCFVIKNLNFWRVPTRADIIE